MDHAAAIMVVVLPRYPDPRDNHATEIMLDMGIVFLVRRERVDYLCVPLACSGAILRNLYPGKCVEVCEAWLE
jgi:hypothetical protein